MARKIDFIDDPRGTLTKYSSGNVYLRWSKDFQKNRNNQFNKAQGKIDSTMLRLMSPLTPFDTGFLIQSSILGTEVGTGLIRYLASYSSANYYDKTRSFNGSPIRGPYWFERAKQKDKAKIERVAGKELL